jgi:hypothetical protein
MGHSRTPTQNTAGDGFPADPIDGYVRPSVRMAVTPSNRAGRHRAARHGRRWAGLADHRHRSPVFRWQGCSDVEKAILATTTP